MLPAANCNQSKVDIFYVGVLGLVIALHTSYMLKFWRIRPVETRNHFYFHICDGGAPSV